MSLRAALKDKYIGWRLHALAHDGRIHLTSAMRLFKKYPDDSVGCVIIDPPARMGVGLIPEDEDRNPSMLDEHASVLSDIAEQCYRVLKPGGITMMIGSPRMGSAWEVAAGWARLNLQGEIVVLWQWQADGRRVAAERASLVSLVRWHAKPGNRTPPKHSIRIESNVLVVDEVPESERVNLVQRPVSLFTYLLSHFTDPKDYVLDPMCGSGSSLVAAILLGRQCGGGDIDSAQCQAARYRVDMAELLGEIESIESVQRIRYWNNGEMKEV